jgi:DNA replication and repair protein RecF
MTAEGRPARAAISRLILQNFRSYRSLDLRCGPGTVALSGANGAGKTNILEAISLLAAGGGLRRAAHADMALQGGPGDWGIAADVQGAAGVARLGTALDPASSESRRCRIDGENVPSAGAFSAHLRLVWLTPSMDGLFAGSASERRRFLDRLVLAIDPEHGGRVAALERALRSRNRLLEQNGFDRAWMDAVEQQIAEIAVSVAAARSETVSRLSALIAEGAQPAFPRAALTLEGSLEEALLATTATAVEDAYRARLADSRWRDKAAGRTLEGPHRSDLLVADAARDMPARRCSTGEQKALLVGIVLAQAQLVGASAGFAPVLLLDEVAAHLDPQRRGALYEAIAALDAQAWLTAADAACFAELGPAASRFEVQSGTVVAG